MPKQRFKLREYTNRSGSVSWRVSGTKRDGTRIQENFADLASAQCRQVELEGEFLSRETDSSLRATRLTDAQVHIAEMGFAKLQDDADLLRAIDHWLKHGKNHAVAESPRLDEAVEKFRAWLEGDGAGNGHGACNLRERSRGNLRIRVNVFSNTVKNLRVNDITPDVVEDFLGMLKVSNVTRDNYRRSLSRFFSWCIQRPRRWTITNPCKEVRIERGETAPPEVLQVSECEQILKSAEAYKGGRLVPYIAACLFAGLRPFEVRRLDWSAVNLADRELRLEGHQTKTKRPRVVSICDTLAEWLQAYSGESFFPTNWRKDFDLIKAQAGFGNADRLTEKQREGLGELKPWPEDVLRHTAISHFFRKTGSYGLTAEQFGNSEAIIKKHYQGRVSSEDTKRFYALRPQKGASK